MKKRHSCFTMTDARLREHNTRLTCNLLDHNQLLVATERVPSQGKFRSRGRHPKLVIATYCPFCGERLETAREAGAL